MRRGHGSTKVPGVKLRPAAPTKYNKTGESSKQTTRQQSIIDDVDSTEILKSCKKPFAGVVVCGSGLTDKISLFQQVVQLGAQTSSDLTDRVTHLVCEKPGSAKYNYCVEHGIPILQPSWITDAYDKWLSGESVDIKKSATIHRFPTFKSVQLCLTGINDVDRRKQIRKQFEKNGGVFVEALDKDTELTHLLCGPDRGESAEQKGLTSKMQFVIKVNKSRTQKVHLVWEDWFWDCIEFQGILDEKRYLATGPRPPRKIRREPSPLLAPIASSAEPIKRKSSAISTLDTSADAEETANIKRMPDAAAVLWENALRKRGFEVREGKLMRSPSKSRISNFLLADDLEPLPSPSSQRREDSMSLTRSRSSLSSAFKRTKSFAVKSTEGERTKSAFQRIRSTPATAFKQSTSATATDSILVKEGHQVPEGERNLFTDLRFRALGEANGPKLTEALELRGGTVVTETDGEADFIIVRLVGGSAFYHNEPSESEREKFRTECWIEQCMFEERICGGDEHPAFVPLRLSTPIPGADTLVVHVSGLNPSEKTPSARLLKAIGATVTDQLSRRNTHLICPCGSGPKFNKAQEWKIPILNLQWLFDIVTSGQLLDVAKYLVTNASSAVPTTSPSEATGMMTDITNSGFVQGSSKKNGNSGKGSDKSQSSTSSSISAATSHVEIEPMFSESWTASDLLSDTVPEYPPTSSPLGQSCHSPAPTTPSPIPKHATVPTGEVGMSRKPSISPFTSPTKSKVMERVPSSATPSPLRIPSMPSRNSHSTSSEQTEKSTASISPSVTTVPALTSTSTLSGESANVLKDAIASLLGKRPSLDDASSSAPGTATGAKADVDSRDNGQQPPPRAAKRSKPPPRTKSRQGQGLVRDGSSDPTSVRSFSRSTSLEVLGMGKSTLASTSSYTFDFTANSPTESVASLLDFNKPMTEVGEESMRVTYEDPSQRAEERRLLNLISGNGSGDVDAMAVDGTDNDSKAVDEGLREGKSQPKPKRKGRNLVRRVAGNGVE